MVMYFHAGGINQQKRQLEAAFLMHRICDYTFSLMRAFLPRKSRR